MEIPHCGRKCDLDKFYDLYRDIIPEEFESECKRGRRTPETEGDDAADEADEGDEADEFDESDENDEYEEDGEEDA